MYGNSGSTADQIEGKEPRDIPKIEIDLNVVESYAPQSVKT